jgi:hydroxyacylglutathione hydrolase
MLIERFFTPELAQVAYAVGDRRAGEVAVIDPRRDVDEYVMWCQRLELRIVAVLETHVHADFISGAQVLAMIVGAPVYASRIGNQDFDHVPVDDGFTLDIGSVRMTAIHTPGHTPEHMAWRAEDRSDPNAAPVLFSGDSLFVGDVGRPDLLGDDQTGALIEQLYKTVTNVFDELPEETIVYPGHTGGSSCGKNIGDDPQTTIGREKRENYAFKPNHLREFREAVMEGMPSPPTYYPELKKVNKVGATPVSSLPDASELHPEEIASRQAAGALIVETRDEHEVARGFIPGSVFAGAGNNMSAWMGWLAPYDRDLILIVDSREAYQESRLMLQRIGLDRVSGYMIGVDRWEAEGRQLESVEEITVDQVRRVVGTTDAPTILDVRSDSEYRDSHIPGARHLFLGKLIQGDLPKFSKDEDVVVVCGTGYRSMVASTLLKDAGFGHLSSLVGGMESWEKAG